MYPLFGVLFLKGTLLLVHPAPAAQSELPAALSLFNGINHVLVHRTPDGPYVGRIGNGIRYVTTGDASYGNPFLVLDPNDNVLFSMRYTPDLDREVLYWRIGDEKRFIALAQTGRASQRPQKCMPESGPGIVITRFLGRAASGAVFEVEERAPFPPPRCRSDRLAYRIRLTQAGEPDSDDLAWFLEQLRKSLFDVFQIGPDDAEISVEASRQGCFTPSFP